MFECQRDSGIHSIAVVKAGQSALQCRYSVFNYISKISCWAGKSQ